MRGHAGRPVRALCAGVSRPDAGAVGAGAWQRGRTTAVVGQAAAFSLSVAASPVAEPGA